MFIFNLPQELLDLIYINLDCEKNKRKFMISYLGYNYDKNKTNLWYIPRRLFGCVDYFEKKYLNETCKFFKYFSILLYNLKPKKKYRNKAITPKYSFWDKDLNEIKKIKSKLSTDSTNLKKNKIINRQSNNLIHSLPQLWKIKSNQSLTLRAILPLAKLDLEEVFI